MDGIHDLGGKQGYGPVKVDDDGRSFHEVWEGREWGIAQSARAPGITIDWWRHCRWMTLEEVASGKAQSGDAGHGKLPEALTLQQVLEEDRAHAFRFDAEIETPPAFSVGQRVITAKHGHTGHTRLPQYARGCCGTVHAYNGAHVFPDLSAEGTETHQHCYNVMFSAAELWPETGASKDKVYLDLWESYLGEV
jgi:nitrile hydratase